MNQEIEVGQIWATEGGFLVVVEWVAKTGPRYATVKTIIDSKAKPVGNHFAGLLDGKSNEFPEFNLTHLMNWPWRSPSKNDLHKRVCNYVRNDLGISREDVERWTKESIEKAVKETVGRLDMEGIVRRTVEAKLNAGRANPVDAIRREVATRVADNLIGKIVFKE